MDLRNLRRCHPSNSMPSLISRLDRLDSMMRYIESKKCSSERSSGDGAAILVKRECVPLDLAVKEAQSKGSILDRITSLEDRLIQLCLDMESQSGSPSSKNYQEEKHPTSCISRKNLLSHSFSRFRSSLRNHNHKLPISRACIDDFEIRKEKEHFKAYPSSEDSDSQGKHDKKTNNDKISPKHKKLHPSNLSHLRLLGC